MKDTFAGLVAVVQYRRREQIEYDPWHNMAAFDSRSVADDYCTGMTKGGMWEYQVVDVPEKVE